MDQPVSAQWHACDGSERIGTIHVTGPDGIRHRLTALDGWRVMEIIRDHGLPIDAECGGACACATCHVHVGPAWAGRLHGPRDEEEEMLDGVANLAPTSRLSCQIIWSPELDGLEIVLPREPGQ
jgi:2Fe-2S ferredoxin